MNWSKTELKSYESRTGLMDAAGHVGICGGFNDKHFMEVNEGIWGRTISYARVVCLDF